MSDVEFASEKAGVPNISPAPLSKGGLSLVERAHVPQRFICHFTNCYTYFDKYRFGKSTACSALPRDVNFVFSSRGA